MFKYAEGLHTLTDRLLYIQKAEAGMVKLRLSAVDVLSLMRDVAEGFQPLAAERRITYEWVQGAEYITIWADREKLSSVIQNLISNAFKYTPEGGKISLSVERKEFDQKPFCCISVTDTGKGIDAGLLQHIFEPFVTGDADPSVSTRMGVGLKIVKHIVEMHHGRVNVESEPGKGTSFAVYLPEGKSHFEEDDCTWDETPDADDKEKGRESISDLMLLPEAEETSQKTEEERTAARQTVLIIEDNTDMRRYLRDLMKKYYRVLEAENGEEGVKVAVEQVPDLVLSDVMMPVMDGFTCCAELRKRKETAHIPILLLTAKAEDKDSVEASYRGADDYVRKPFNPEVLLAKVAHLLDMRRRLKQIYTRTLLHTSSVSAEKPEGTESEFMQQVLSCIEGHASNPEFNVKVLAGELHMSQATLYRKLKQHTDLSAVELIRHIRMTQAAFLLMETSLPVTEVAERVGFNDLPTFRKHFTDMFGVSPSKYAEDNQKNK
jgi:DNA-binding response OmpR family regulator/two-component sensor histidine kinase